MLTSSAPGRIDAISRAPDQAARLARQRHVQRHRVAFGEQLVELDEPDAVARDRQDVVRPDLDAEREQPRRDRTADPPEPDDADAQLRERSQRARRLRVPAAARDVAVERDDPAQQRYSSASAWSATSCVQ